MKFECMSAPDWYVDDVLTVTSDDKSLFHKWTWHLPEREHNTPYHSGSHSLSAFRNALLIAGFNRYYAPKHIVEVGFCLGHSASIFLELGAEKVTSIEISDRPETMKAAEMMSLKWKDRFTFSRPGAIASADADIAYVDGDHSLDSIISDFKYVETYNPKWILADDYFPKWGATQEAMHKLGYKAEAILGTMVLCRKKQ